MKFYTFKKISIISFPGMDLSFIFSFVFIKYPILISPDF